MIQQRVFTLEEANGLLPGISAQIETLRALQEIIAKKEVEIDALELISDTDSEKGSDLMHKEIESLNASIGEFNAAVDKIHEEGCFLKDLELGLVDFYSVMNGNPVYLCWKYGEDRIRFWHEVGKGYASRQPVQP